MITGLIPAGGDGTRWGGFPKELLPVDRQMTALERCAQAMVLAGAQRLVVVTSSAKVGLHAARLTEAAVDVALVLRRGLPGDLWSGVRDALPWCSGRVLFGMPDTVFPLEAFQSLRPVEGLSMGVFATMTPERFGVVLEDRTAEGSTLRVIEKPKLAAPQIAWGILSWPAPVTSFWQTLAAVDFTDALNAALRGFEFAADLLDEYTDFASWEDYREWMAPQELRPVTVRVQK